MKNLIFALAFVTTTAFGTTFTCTSSLNGNELKTESVVVTEDQTELSLGFYKDIELVGTAIMGQVSALMFFDGVMFGSISMGEASYDMFMVEDGELSLYCRLND